MEIQPKYASDFYNLVYEDYSGGEVKARKRTDVRQHQLETGETVSHTKMAERFEFVGKINEQGYFITRRRK